MTIVLFIPMRLLILGALPYGQTFTQNYFITEGLPRLLKKMCDFVVNIQVAILSFLWTIRGVITARRSWPKLNTGDLSELHTHSILHQSSCDFWLFAVVKNSLKDREIQGVKTLISVLTDIWNDPIFEDVQAFFLDWMERLSWIINNNGGFI
jgi:hypothetical protein